MTTIRRWSGRETRALREAKRMSICEFASRLGVSDRMISKWEAGGTNIHPRPVNQAALDTFLGQAGPEVQARFELLIRDSGLRYGDDDTEIDIPIWTKHRHPVDGKIMTLVHAGVFLCGPTAEPVWLPAFCLDVHPTSNADYARFVAATGHPPPAHWVDGCWPDGSANHPVVFVTWADAEAYAAWAGKRLPTAQQWEKAARGTTGNVYPWGNRRTPAKCNVREGGLGETTPVDRYHSGVGPYGTYDLCGNVWEWCDSESTLGRYELKGGAYTSSFDRATPAAFNDASVLMSDDDTGFRCTAPTTTFDGYRSP